MAVEIAVLDTAPLRVASVLCARLSHAGGSASAAVAVAQLAVIVSVSSSETRRDKAALTAAAVRTILEREQGAAGRGVGRGQLLRTPLFPLDSAHDVLLYESAPIILGVASASTSFAFAINLPADLPGAQDGPRIRISWRLAGGVRYTDGTECVCALDLPVVPAERSVGYASMAASTASVESLASAGLPPTVRLGGATGAHGWAVPDEDPWQRLLERGEAPRTLGAVLACGALSGAPQEGVDAEASGDSRLRPARYTLTALSGRLLGTMTVSRTLLRPGDTLSCLFALDSAQGTGDAGDSPVLARAAVEFSEGLLLPGASGAVQTTVVDVVERAVWLHRQVAWSLSIPAVSAVPVVLAGADKPQVSLSLTQTALPLVAGSWALRLLLLQQDSAVVDCLFPLQVSL